ncbi:hypothetical protein CDL15_Pgr025930 [Punica granatum]|uniref:Uncharacterized protein n=1 Tax=Punica granatum TaxID=22663 RepID=A0A218VUV1_PUNGR|nr:hypothetical protein CDL15_Pgr011504 [Punica granatum]OWM70080.1 hypothetical protein CDL15_Pgr025930 [Punica granatum]PKI35133.1 hypothetical protein CRG98_044484 [Punica granatum]
MKYKKLRKFKLEHEEWSGQSFPSTSSRENYWRVERGENYLEWKVAKLSEAIRRFLKSREGNPPVKAGVSEDASQVA